MRPFLLDLTQEFSSRSLYNLFSLIVSVFLLGLYSVFNVLALFEVLPSKLNKVSQCASACSGYFS